MFACTISEPKFPQIYSFTNPKKNIVANIKARNTFGGLLYVKKKDTCNKKVTSKYLQHIA
jgi:hypothetical protein